jgi:hypothetical protein
VEEEAVAPEHGLPPTAAGRLSPEAEELLGRFDFGSRHSAL